MKLQPWHSKGSRPGRRKLLALLGLHRKKPSLLWCANFATHILEGEPVKDPMWRDRNEAPVDSRLDLELIHELHFGVNLLVRHKASSKLRDVVHRYEGVIRTRKLVLLWILKDLHELLILPRILAQERGLRDDEARLTHGL